MDPKSKHILIDAWGIPFEPLDDENYIRYALEEMAKASGATIVNWAKHKYSPQGISYVLLVSESHISIHTYPEEGYLAADIFTCGKADPTKAIPVIERLFKPKLMTSKIIIRGERVE